VLRALAACADAASDGVPERRAREDAARKAGVQRRAILVFALAFDDAGWDLPATVAAAATAAAAAAASGGDDGAAGAVRRSAVLGEFGLSASNAMASLESSTALARAGFFSPARRFALRAEALALLDEVSE
jgi:hypothetical protein